LIAAVIILAAWNRHIEKQIQTLTTRADGVDVVATNAQIKADKLANNPPAHDYQLINQGSRTFRFDPATGDSCIQLASKEDWKRPETIRQGCQYYDLVNSGDPSTRASLINAAQCMLVGVAKACQNPK